MGDSICWESINLGYEKPLISNKILLLSAIIIVLIVSSGCSAVFVVPQKNRTNLAKSVKVACVGDSITEWSGYPAHLQDMLGTNYNVGEFGAYSSTVSANSDKPYMEQVVFQEAKSFDPSIVVIMLGTNDAHICLSTNTFHADFTRLVLEYQMLASQPKIFLATPPPIFDNDLNLSDTNLQEHVIPYIEQAAFELSLPIIDINAALTDRPECFEDGVHPNSEGASMIASKICEAIDIDGNQV